MHQGNHTWDPRRLIAMVVECVINIQVHFRDQITKVDHMTTTTPGATNPGTAMDNKEAATIKAEDHSEMIEGTHREKYGNLIYLFNYFSYTEIRMEAEFPRI